MRGSKKQVMVGCAAVGGGAPVLIQSMLSAPADDVEANVTQAEELAAAGCDILRVAVPDMESVRLIGAIKRKTKIPLVADIHFDYRLALESVAEGADKIRINPGNIGDSDKIRQVSDACRKHGAPIRIGVNSGSLEKDILLKYGGPTPGALAESALRNAAMLEDFGFGDIVLSLKSSDVATTVAAYRIIAGQCDYPLHIGVTESGTKRMGTLKSAIGIGSLLLDGIGDTLRVSLTALPVEEVAAGRDILKALGMIRGPVVISCPTCGRCKIDLFTLARQVEDALAAIDAPLTVAVMGCAVNGPGEASHADLGVACGDGFGLIFAGGKIVEKVAQDEILPALIAHASALRLANRE